MNWVDVIILKTNWERFWHLLPLFFSLTLVEIKIDYNVLGETKNSAIWIHSVIIVLRSIQLNRYCLGGFKRLRQIFSRQTLWNDWWPFHTCSDSIRIQLKCIIHFIFVCIKTNFCHQTAKQLQNKQAALTRRGGKVPL